MGEWGPAQYPSPPWGEATGANVGAVVMGEALCPGAPVLRAGPTNHQITEEVSAIQNHHCNECIMGYTQYEQ